MKSISPRNSAWKAILVFSFVFFFSCEKENLVEHEETLPFSSIQKSGNKLIEGQYIVILSKKPAKKDSKAAEVLEKLSKTISSSGQGKVKHKYKNALTGFSAQLSKEEVTRLKRNPNVLHVEQDSYMQLEGETSVQDYPIWGLDRIDQRDVLLDRAYSYTATGKGVNVYIMDSGINYSHSEFGNRAVLAHDFVLDENPDNTDPNQQAGEDCRGHGTHVAGTVGGDLYGVAKDVNLHSLRVFGCSGGCERSRIVAAVDWLTKDVIENNKFPAVVNMSLGGPFEPEFLSVQTAIETSISAGINYVVSAGNGSTEACSQEPAYIPGILTIGATDIDNRMASFSNYGSCVDLFAPGVSIVSASNLDNTLTNTYSGTSMAAPHVTGIVALYLETHPNATPEEVHKAVVENSTKNMVLTLQENTTTNLANSNFEPVNFVSPPSPSLDLAGEIVKEKGDHVAYLSWVPTSDPFVDVYRDGRAIRLHLENNGSYRDDTNYKGNTATYVYKICETNYSNCSETVVNYGGGDTAVVNSPPTSDYTFSINSQTVYFYDSSSDSDGYIVNWLWDFGDGNFSSEQNPVHTYLNPGEYKASVTVTDDDGAESTPWSSNIVIQDTTTPNPGTPLNFDLRVTPDKIKGTMAFHLEWNPSSSENVDIYKNGEFVTTVQNYGVYTDHTNLRGSGTIAYKICEAGSSDNCSQEVVTTY